MALMERPTGRIRLVPPMEAEVEIRSLYGVVAEFTTPEALLNAVRLAHDEGYRRMDAYSPFPVDGLSDALGHRDQYIPSAMLAGGILGGLTGFSLLYYCMVIAYPLNVGGRPLYSWPVYIPITFEMTVLLSALTGVLGMFVLNGLPEPYHPIFETPGFDRATTDRFFLCIEARDPRFDRERVRALLGAVNATAVSDLELTQ